MKINLYNRRAQIGVGGRSRWIFIQYNISRNYGNLSVSTGEWNRCFLNLYNNEIIHIYIYIYIYMKFVPKVLIAHPRKRAIAEHSCSGYTLPRVIKLEKLIKISVLISVLVKPIQRWEVFNGYKTRTRLRTVWLTLIYIYIYIVSFISSLIMIFYKK